MQKDSVSDKIGGRREPEVVWVWRAEYIILHVVLLTTALNLSSTPDSDHPVKGNSKHKSVKSEPAETNAFLPEF